MTDLPKRELGRTGLQVTMLGYGAMEIRGAPRGRDVTESQSETILNAVLDAGINYIDTSIDYGLSESRIGTIDPAHLQDNVDALLKGPLPPDVYAEVKRRLAAVGLRPEP